MEILIVTDTLPIGGSTTYLYSLVNELLNQKHTIHLVTFGSDKLIFQQHPNLFYTNIFVNQSYSLRSFPQKLIGLTRHIISKKLSYKLIITDLVSPTLPLIFIKKLIPTLQKIPHIYQFHGSNVLEKQSSGEFDYLILGFLKKLFHRYLEKFVLNHVSKIVVFSNFSQSIINQNYHLGSKVLLLSPGLDYRFSSAVNRLTKATAKEQLGFNSDTPLILVVSRIEKRKGLEEMLVNFQKHYKGSGQLVICSNFNLVVYSIFPLLDNLQLGAKVKLIHSPSRKELSLLYRAATVTLMPSQQLETFGFVTLESHFFGTPVIGFNIGANSELIEKKLLINPFNWTNFYQQVARLEKLNSNQYKPLVPVTPDWHIYVQNITSINLISN